MSVIIILISASLVVALGFLAAFIWSVKSGQFEDDYTPSVRILFDNSETKGPGAPVNNNNKQNINSSICNSKNSRTTTKS